MSCVFAFTLSLTRHGVASVSCLFSALQQSSRRHFAQNGQVDGDSSVRWSPLELARRQYGFGVLPNLFGRFKQLVVTCVIIVFTIDDRVRAADVGPILVGPTLVVDGQVFAVSMYH